MAYIRTGIGLLAITISLIKLFSNAVIYVIGILFIILAITPIVYGIYRRINKKIEKVVYKCKRLNTYFGVESFLKADHIF